jgi:hypothetical protein
MKLKPKRIVAFMGFSIVESYAETVSLEQKAEA